MFKFSEKCSYSMPAHFGGVEGITGPWTYEYGNPRTEKALLQLLALGTLQHYLNLAIQHSNLATREKDKFVDSGYGNYLQSGAFACEDFAPDFVSYLRERIPDLKCVDKIS